MPMKLPNWFRVLWWLVLCAATSCLLLSRMSDISAGRANAADVVFFAIWLALVLVPVFSEIKLGSFLELKQAIEKAKEEVKRDVKTELDGLRLDLRNAVDVRTNISPQFNFPQPARDEQLPQIEQIIKAAIADANKTTPAPGLLVPVSGASTDVKFLFETRYEIEREIRRLARLHGLDAEQRWPMPALRMAQTLSDLEIVPKRLVSAIREVYAVCSPAIHGEPVTPAQISFVRDVGPSLVLALRAL